MSLFLGAYLEVILCTEVEVKDWLRIILSLKCASYKVAIIGNCLYQETHPVVVCHFFMQMLSGQQRAQLESETINFFKQCVVCHSENQVRFAQVLCEIMHNGGKVFIM